MHLALAPRQAEALRVFGRPDPNPIRKARDS